MAPSLQKLANRGKPALILFLLAAIVLTAFLGLCIYFAVQPETPVRYFNGDAVQPQQRLYIPVHEAIEQFAGYTDREDEGFYLVFSQEPASEFYIVYGGKALEETLQPVQDYTYGRGDIVPEPVYITGYARAVPLDLKPYVLEVCSYIFAVENFVTEENFDEFFGAYYLDTTYDPNREALYLFWFCILAIAAAAYILLRRDAKANDVTKATCEALGQEALQQAAWELGLETTVLRALDLRLTRTYLIACRGGLQIVPLGQIAGVTQWTYGRKLHIVLLLRDERQLRLPPRRTSAAAQQEYALLKAAALQPSEAPDNEIKQP